jgi:Tfp pilus assembly protein PilF
MPSTSSSSRLALALLVALGLAACERAESPGTPFAPTEAERAELDRGVGLMGRFDFASAREVFGSLAERHPAWYEAKLDLAIATLNRQQEGDEAAAREQARALSAARPGDLRPVYLQGLIALHSESPVAAEPFLRRVAEGDPGDAYAAYFLGQSLLQQQRTEEALARFERAMTLDPQLRSARYGAAQALQRLGRRAEAAAALEEFQRQRNNPLARLAEFKYTRMGRKSEAVGMPDAAPAAAVVAGPLFAEPAALVAARPDIASQPVASAADLDGDGRIDLYVPGGRGNRGTVLVAQGAGFEAQPAHPLAAFRDVEFAAWGDLDNDGLTDVLLCRVDAPPRLLRQAPRGTWTALEVPVLGDTGASRDCALFDADHDGDLDLFVVGADGARTLLSNNGDGSFRSLAERLPPPARGAPALQVVAADLDNDRDLDLIVLHEGGPHEVLVNDRLWNWRGASGFDAFVREPALAAVAVDLEATGEADLVTLAPDLSLRRWSRGRDGAWSATILVPATGAPPAGARVQLAALDVDGDGRPELIATSARGLTIWRLSSGRAERLLDVDDAALSAWVFVTLDVEGPELLTHHRDGAVWRRGAGSGRAPFVLVELRGRIDAAQSIRSNASGIGARIAARIGGRFVAVDGVRPASGPGQSLMPIAIGLDGQARIDYLTIDWSDGVFQTELALQGGTRHAIAETQRQLSSCPLLFAWDGRRFAFVSDVLGVGGLGYLLAPGEYAPPRPRESFLFPPGLPVANAGRLAIKIGEPMEETAYLDRVQLVAYDLPPGVSMALDERMQIGGPAVTGRPLFFAR